VLHHADDGACEHTLPQSFLSLALHLTWLCLYLHPCVCQSFDDAFVGAWLMTMIYACTDSGNLENRAIILHDLSALGTGSMSGGITLADAAVRATRPTRASDGEPVLIPKPAFVWDCREAVLAPGVAPPVRSPLSGWVWRVRHCTCRAMRPSPQSVHCPA
jgi:hypothetical protein